MRGAFAEIQFAAECLSRGINPSRPMAVTRYDLLSEHNGKILRIQIKLTTHLETRNSEGCYKTSGGGYTKDEVDIIAVYINGDFYIIPINLLNGTKTIRVYTETRHKEFKNAYNLLM